MSTNSFRKRVVQRGGSALVKPGLRKPPQGELVNGARLENGVHLPVQQIPAGWAGKGSRTALPATWTEAIQDPQVWAELRPLLVDED